MKKFEMSKTGHKIIAGLKETIAHAPADARICDLMNGMRDVVIADGATWYKIHIEIWHGRDRRKLSKEGGLG